MRQLRHVNNMVIKIILYCINGPIDKHLTNIMAAFRNSV